MLRFRLTVIFTLIALLSMLSGAYGEASNTLPEWRTATVPEKIVSFDSINGFYFALSETNTLYICSHAIEQTDCRWYGSVGSNSGIVQELIDKKIDDGPHCQSMKESLIRFWETEQPIVDCEVRIFHGHSSVDAAFLVASDGTVWEWVRSRSGVVNNALQGAILGAWLFFVLVVPTSLILFLPISLLGSLSRKFK